MTKAELHRRSCRRRWRVEGRCRAHRRCLLRHRRSSEAKKGDKVAWPGFGSFSTTKRPARTGRNPQTGAPVKIAASTAMKFSASSTLKSALNPGR